LGDTGIPTANPVPVESNAETSSKNEGGE
jgi:hypothetical protein